MVRMSPKTGGKVSWWFILHQEKHVIYFDWHYISFFRCGIRAVVNLYLILVGGAWSLTLSLCNSYFFNNHDSNFYYFVFISHRYGQTLCHWLQSLWFSKYSQHFRTVERVDWKSKKQIIPGCSWIKNKVFIYVGLQWPFLKWLVIAF